MCFVVRKLYESNVKNTHTLYMVEDIVQNTPPSFG